MAKPVKHTVEGLTDTRMSPRNYTFATVVTVSPDYERKHVMPRDVEYAARTAGADWDYNAKVVADGKVRSLFQPGSSLYSAEREAKWQQESQDNAAKFLAQFPQRQLYVDARVALVTKRYEERHANGEFRTVMSWHQSANAANKFASSVKGYIKVEVLPVIRAAEKAAA